MKHRFAGTAPPPVFADPRGRRRFVVRWLAIGASGIFSSFVAVAGTGLLGGPRVPLLPWPHAHASQAPGARHARHARHTAAAGLPTPGLPGPGRPRAATPSPAPGRSAPPSPTPSPTSTMVTNPVGRTPPGRNHTASPSPRRTKPV